MRTEKQKINGVDNIVQVEAGAMAIALVAACMRVHMLYTAGGEAPFAGPGWIIAFACLDGFMLVSVLALAITQASQARARATAASPPHPPLSPRNAHTPRPTA